jgi:hypothetical protein
MGWGVRPEPLPQLRASAAQYLSQPQQMRSGCLGNKAIFLAISGPAGGAPNGKTSELAMIDA